MRNRYSLSMVEEQDNPFETYPALASVARFVRLIPKVPWFQAIGNPMDQNLRRDGRSYLESLGFPDAEPALIPVWEDAAISAESIDWNGPAWEAEEQLRAHLLDLLQDRIDADAAEVTFTYVGGVAADAARAGAAEAAEFLQISDDAFLHAAVGAAVQACHLATLVLATEGMADHPFSLKYQLFEQGRWPIGISGNSFNIF